jgi:hypothetical protein
MSSKYCLPDFDVAFVVAAAVGVVAVVAVVQMLMMWQPRFDRSEVLPSC